MLGSEDAVGSRSDNVVVMVDGTGLMYRAFYAIRGLTGPRGEPTNAVYGFTNMLLRLIDDYSPAYMGVVFDRGKPAYRLELYSEYKGHRPEMPDELRTQFAPARRILEAMGIPCVQIEDVEADDVIGTLADRFSERGREILIVTGDKDFLQLVSPRVSVLLTRRGITEMDLYDVAKVQEELGIPPERLADMKGLMGDSSDNIPGVPGVGEKTALKLLHQFHSLEETLSRLDEVPGNKLPESLREHAEAARMSRELAVIRRDIPVDVTEDDYRMHETDHQELASALRQLGFRSLLKRLELDAQQMEDAPPADLILTVVDDDADLCEILDGLRDQGDDFFVDWFPGESGAPLYAAVASAEAGFCMDNRDGEGEGLLRRSLELLMGTENGRIVGHSLGALLAWGRGYPVKCDLFDTEVAAYLLDPARSSYPLQDLAYGYLGADLPVGSDLQEAEDLAGPVASRLSAMSRLVGSLEAEMQSVELRDLFGEVEMPLVPILAEMQRRGVRVDADILEDIGTELDGRIADLEQSIWEIAGRLFNINSPKQLGEVLFGDLELPVIKKTKTGYSTDSEVLEQLASEHELPGLVLKYRNLVKLRGTYVSGLLKQIDPDTGRVHTTFRQTVTATGRLSSVDPNLQNIPIRDEEARKLRRAFGTAPGWKLVAADYSQIELRVLAHFSEDEKLMDSFRRGEDIHQRTAAEVFGVQPDEVTGSMRATAKAVNFGIIYGQTGYGLSRTLHIDPEESQQYIDDYLSGMPGVRRYVDRVVGEARKTGYVRTLMGRIRYLPELNDRVYHRRRFAERAALNTPIQGTAADIIKKAMVEVCDALAERGIPAHMLLQVHDELIWEVRESHLEELCTLVREVMETAVQLRVPLRVDLKAGDNWYDMAPVPADGG